MQSAAKTTALVSVCALLLMSVVSGCGGSNDKARAASSPSGPRGAPPTSAQLAEARRLLNPQNSSPGPSASDVACVARVVVQDPNVDAMANDMAQIPNKDLRQLVMTDYLHCAYNFVLDLYMKFAPAGLSPDELHCMRGKFTELSVDTLSEVMVEDPDAGQTGPLVMQSCASHSPQNPLAHGLPNGGS